MCEPNYIHPLARSEYADIAKKGNYTQRTAAALAWVDAVLACSTRSQNGLQSGTYYPTGKLYFAEHAIGATRGIAVVALYGKRCLDVFAADVTASGWWHKTQPLVRAGDRLP
jgi:hypothetical protein